MLLCTLSKDSRLPGKQIIVQLSFGSRPHSLLATKERLVLREVLLHTLNVLDMPFDSLFTGWLRYRVTTFSLIVELWIVAAVRQHHAPCGWHPANLISFSRQETVRLTFLPAARSNPP